MGINLDNRTCWCRELMPSIDLKNEKGRLWIVRGRCLVALIMVATVLMMTACSSDPYVSKEPTAYVVSRFISGKATESYLTEEHPDVKAVTALLESFLVVDMNQDWRQPNYEPLTGLARESLIEERAQEQAALIDNKLSYQSTDYQIDGIVFREDGEDNALRIATVQMQMTVVYTSASEEWLTRFNLPLEAELVMYATMDLKKTDDQWIVTSTNYDVPSPSE